MPDISMCKNKQCPSKQQCRRFTAEPNPHRQAYMGFTVPEGDDRCDSFWDNEIHIEVSE